MTSISELSVERKEPRDGWYGWTYHCSECDVYITLETPSECSISETFEGEMYRFDWLMLVMEKWRDNHCTCGAYPNNQKT